MIKNFFDLSAKKNWGQTLLFYVVCQIFTIAFTFICATIALGRFPVSGDQFPGIIMDIVLLISVIVAMRIIFRKKIYNSVWALSLLVLSTGFLILTFSSLLLVPIPVTLLTMFDNKNNEEDLSKV
ncbi:MAG: hypothetical protein LBJ74_00435 [Heliobacteriaceae bacterium]|jgi:hypothetical protein|nr:hypothetical protein [Heliobacteriaceae bacterium]